MKEPIVTNKIKSSYTLDDCNRIISDASARFKAAAIADGIMKENALADMLAMGYKPPTRWQKFKYRMQDLKRRIKDIWIIVSGGDVHKNCDY